MKLTSTILSLAALFSVASAVPTPSSTTTTSATVVYNSAFDSTTSISEFTTTTFVGGVSSDSPWNSGSCLQITSEETDVYVTITEDDGTDINVIEVSSDVITQFLQVSVLDVETVDLDSITFKVEVFAVDESYCVS